MAQVTETPKKKNDPINFTLKVKASRKKDGPFEWIMDLNPDFKLLDIDETFSTQRELAIIFQQIVEELKKINDRTNEYNSVLEINEKKKRTLKFNDGYEQNFKPEFGKIDRIVHKRNSPEESSVSHTRRYNGDKQPL